MKVSEAVAKRIRELTNAKKTTLYKIYQQSGLSQSTFNYVIYAKYKGVNLTTLIAIIRTLGISVAEFFESPLFSEENLDD